MHVMRIFIAILYTLVNSVHSRELQMPIVEVNILGAGLHRKIAYIVRFNDSLVGAKCEYILKQNLPAAVYVNTDELEDLKRLGKLDGIFPRFVDIEVPTEKAKPFDVYLRAAPKIADNLILPIHYRYHAPHPVNRFSFVELTKPIMYIKCSSSEETLLESNRRYCLDCDLLNISPQTNQSIDNENCNWILLPPIYRIVSSLKASIPVGSKMAYTSVFYGTILISWCAVLWSMFSVFQRVQDIKYKL
uniref:Phosphatidylinositol-glycan biosynthesis class X protein n=1 Tax=Glossina brevipalpis TaxID=37001 RepID=A0A1A9WGL8_9MUSC